ncbi:MAG TPA: UDP-N-acetylmuramoyl-tripeptide--D-alanyl-D-alanine ligase [Jatrophihabitans sp.]|nr:UDP-N-acetylmuramoyl-tripeptide--D-alanyl-D-alanine ligase [Jatrophihabitans sp.]
MITLTLAEVARIVGGTPAGIDPDRAVSGKVEFDSRKVVPGDLFLAFEGSQVDGHDFAAAAVEAGAVAVLATRELPNLPSIRVDDPITAITALAGHAGPRLPALKVGVTGSSGKTSTKDLLAQLFEGLGPTVAPPESFNNELGFPYTVLLADERTRYLVLEMSARGVGHIAHLARIVAPQVGVVLNVGSAHLGEFGSVTAIAQAKGELVEALSPEGIAVLNADDPLVRAMAGRTRARVISFGESSEAAVRATDVSVDTTGRASFTLHCAGESAPVRLSVLGEHQVSNALAAAAAALSQGASVPDVAAGLSSAGSRSHWRMEVSEVGGVTVINDAYNANPESVRAALKSLAIMATGRRSIAVLGAMTELGPDALAEHDGIGRLAVRLDVNALIAVGDGARPIFSGASLEGSWNGEAEWAADNDAALQRLTELVQPGDVVLVKGSRVTELQQVALGLIEWLRARG